MVGKRLRGSTGKLNSHILSKVGYVWPGRYRGITARKDLRCRDGTYNSGRDVSMEQGNPCNPPFGAGIAVFDAVAWGRRTS